MVWDQGPGVALGLGFFEDVGEPFQERLAVVVIEEDLSSLYSPGHDVLEKAGGVKSWLAGHGLSFWHGFHGWRGLCFFVVGSLVSLLRCYKFGMLPLNKNIGL